MNQDINSVKTYQRYFKRLIQLERNEEMNKQMDEIKGLTGKQREKRGRAVLGVSGRDAGRGLGGIFLVKLFSRFELPKSEIGVGDLVILSQGDPEGNEEQATVVEKGKKHFTIAYNQQPSRYVYGRNLRLDLFANDVTYQRMMDAVFSLKEGKDLSEFLLLNKNPENMADKGNDTLSYHNQDLNNSQKDAIEKAIEAKDVFLIHGPPGTGKTTTLVEYIYQESKVRGKILATADSNTAIDNMVDKLLKYDLKVVRIGNPARMHTSLISCTLDKLLQDEDEYQEAATIWDKVMDMREDQKKFVPATASNRRGLTDDQIINLAKKGVSHRGVPNVKLRKMASWLKIQHEINFMVDRAKHLEEVAVSKIIDKSDVVCTTNVSAGTEILNDFRFSLCCIDEATQSMEPSCLIPMIKSKKWVLAGDHKQLPPTVLCHEAKGLYKTLFEKWVKPFEQFSAMLNIQYRMHKDIMGFSNNNFYSGKLLAHPSVAHHTLNDLSGYNYIDIPDKEFEQICSAGIPKTFIDVPYGVETRKKGAYSIFNEEEVNAVRKAVDYLFQCKVFPEDIGVISPYEAQVQRIKEELDGSTIEVKTVDGFQGREKEIIIYSCVRSNAEGELGFLKDYRRLNVAITRAKRKLIIIGNKETLEKDRYYKELVR